MWENGEEAAIETALSREMRQNREKEGRRERKVWREGMKAPLIYEAFAFPLKNNVSRNRDYDIQPRGRTSLLFRCRDANAPLEVIMQRKTNCAANMMSDSETDSGFIDRESRLYRRREKERVVVTSGKIGRAEAE